MEEFLQLVEPLLEPNFLYVVVIGAAWVGVLALFHPGSGVLEMVAGVGVLAGVTGLVYLGAGALGLALLAVSFALYALAVWFNFPAMQAHQEAAPPEGLAARQRYALWLSLAATVIQVIAGIGLFVGVPGVAFAVVLLAALASLAVERWMLAPAVRALRPPPQTGVEALIGARAVVRRAARKPSQTCMVFLNGELWQAEADQPLAEGDEVEVVERDGMRLRVRKVP